MISKFIKSFNALVLAGCFICSISTVYATHYAGTDLFYQSLGNNQYKITLVFYRDCAGVQEPNSADLVLTNLCGSSNSSFTIYKKTNGAGFTNGEEITSVCSTAVSTCNGGTVAGLRKWVYEGDITLPVSTCTDWKVSYQLCCRNFAITTLQNPGGESLYTETVFKSNIIDQAPQFTNNPIAFACVNQAFNFNQGAFDADGDSMAYELDNPLSSGGNPVVFAQGFSKTNPMATTSGITLDSITGAISFLPSMLQVGVIAVKVKQYRNGSLIGYVRRDMEIFITNCNANNLPVLSGFNGTSTYTLNVCAGETINSFINSFDSDYGQQLEMHWNQGIANAAFTSTASGMPTGNINWMTTLADTADNPHVFTVTVKDNACPMNGMQTFSYIINVLSPPVVSISSGNATCSANNGSATVNFQAGINFNYQWSNGSSTSAIQNLIPGTYTVTVSNATGCSATLTAAINQTGTNIYSGGFVSADNGSCNGNINLTMNSGTFPFTFLWSNGTSSQNLSNACSGSYSVVITDAYGCTGSASYYLPLKGAGCNISLTTNVNPTGNCNQGGLISIKTNGIVGKANAILTNSIGVMVAQKNFQKTVAFDALYQDTYTVTVTSQDGCTETATAVISAGGCGVPINVQVINVTSNLAKVIWDDCGAISYVVKYKIAGTGPTWTYCTVTNAHEVVLSSLNANTVYTVMVKALCMQGMQSQFALAEKFCTGNCLSAKVTNESDYEDASTANVISKLSVWPNPSKDIIKLSGFTNRGTITTIRITNMMGITVKTINQFVDEVFEIPIEIQDLANGVYLVHIEGYENAVHKFIKQ